MNKLRNYSLPEDLKEMSVEDMEILSAQIREFLVDSISRTGGHLASNLGVVELTIALHKVFNTPEDQLIWDVGHQSYVHKILTGRADQFNTLRQFGGMSGFPKVKESPYDTFDTGHSSTSISVAAGMSAARDLNGDDYHVAAIIGDGSLTGGIAYEALNNVGASHSDVIVILNDNGMSIEPNTGGVSTHLSKLRSSEKYNDFKRKIKNNVSQIPGIGKAAVSGMMHIRDTIKYAMIEGAMFESLGFKYFGPIDGHDFDELIETLEAAKAVDGPVLVHVVTKKGKGYVNAETNPSKFHGTGPFDPVTGNALKPSSGPSYSAVFGNKLMQIAADNDKVVAISAAMLEGTGLSGFAKTFPERTFDVGIAEGHAVTFAAGMATKGFRPVVAVYSTFLQRAYDQIIQDVALQNLPVIFGIDRAGIVGADGETHHGMFDLSYLNHIPNMTVMAPADKNELEAMMDHAMTLDNPCAIRYPRGATPEIEFKGQPDRSYTVSEGTDVEIWSVGNMLDTAVKAADMLRERGLDAGVINARIVKPLDLEALEESASRTKLIVTLEDNVVSGGFGQTAAAELKETAVLNLGWPDEFIEHGSSAELYEKFGLDAESITERICNYIEE